MRRFVRRRPRQRGAVAVEFALSLVFLIPLMLGILDYGHYFWVGVNAVEAARAGGRDAARTSGLAGCPAAKVTAATTAATATVTTQMAKTGLSASYTTITQSCVTTPVNPSWRIQVQVDFPPAVGFMTSWMPASAISGRVRFRSPTMVTPP